jgi:hypothetical protein
MCRCSSPLGRASGIEHPDLAHLRRLGKMSVAIDHGVTAREGRHESFRPTHPRPRHVDHADSNRFHLYDAALGQNVPKRRLVHVPDHPLDRSELPEFLQHGSRDEVAGVKDQVRSLQPPQALRRQPPPTPRQVGIRDDCDERQSAAPFTKAPS